MENEQLVPPGPPPNLEGFVAPDYSRRDLFEEMVFKQIGMNPFDINPDEEVRKADRNLPELFNHVFQGQVVWTDRHRLNKKQLDYWNDMVNQYHHDVYNQHLSNKKMATEKYNFFMNQFDNSAKEYQSTLNRFREKEQLKRQAEKETEVYRKKKDIDIEYEQKEAPAKAAAQEAKDQKELETYRKKKKIDVEERTTKSEDVKRAYDLERSIMKEYELKPGSQIPAPALRTLNRARAAAGIPELKESIVPGKKKTLMGVDWMWPDVEPKYEYSETEGKQERTVVEERNYKGRKLVKYSDGSIEWAK